MPKNALNPYKFIDATSLGATFSSQSVATQYLDIICIHLLLTGTPTGTFEVQGSVKPSPDSGDWVALDLPSVPTAAGADINFLLDIALTGISFVRVVYTRTSGTGTINGWIAGKG